MTERFVCFLVCGNKVCGEVVAVCGRVTHEHHEQYEEDVGRMVSFDSTYYVPTQMYPAPPVFALSTRLKKDLAAHVRKAFELLWVDPASCANRIRVFLEFLMDYFEIPRSDINAKGEEYDLKLYHRIERLEAKKPGHKKTFNALCATSGTMQAIPARRSLKH
ncbi:DUF4145 domain-containing protein [Mesorhizobium sp. M1342]|uniref:DUF4145 domain-containing protein n=1 Tax=Mesorhizobium sp. M1342 TaxID=2957088 RepID=UPI0033399FDE